MFWFGEYGAERLKDWRPEVHDSDGLAIWTGSGERIWRPLNNPDATRVSAFADENPKGFGLMQRDRNFDHYQDGVFYDRRPSVWSSRSNRSARAACSCWKSPPTMKFTTHRRVLGPGRQGQQGQRI
ncbi:glucan biosynthesis protein [Halopseudomonas pachastrellae]|nr:glucan biosynthesis protein [Halopseudomonas pachastrellae]